MNKKAKLQNKSGREHAVDAVKDVLVWVLVTGLAFLYWMAMLLILSLFLLNVWHVTFEEIVRISLVLTAVTSVGYLGVIIYRRMH